MVDGRSAEDSGDLPASGRFMAGPQHRKQALLRGFLGDTASCSKRITCCETASSTGMLVFKRLCEMPARSLRTASDGQQM